MAYEKEAECFWERVDRSNKKPLNVLCKEIGLNYNTVRSNRASLRIPSCMDVLVLSKALNVSMEYLLEGKEDNEFLDYIAYLKKADKWQIAAVRRILEMPDLK